MKNLKFSYLYRDAGNYKKCGSVVFSNPDSLSPESVEKAVRKLLPQDGLFVASQIRIPECFLFANAYANSDDHCFHEFDQIQSTLELPNDCHNRSIGQFVKEIEQEAKRGWITFDPHGRLSFR
jgi:hypothetical protein